MLDKTHQRKLQIYKNHVCANVVINICLIIVSYYFISFKHDWFQIEYFGKKISLRINSLQIVNETDYMNLQNYTRNQCEADFPIQKIQNESLEEDFENVSLDICHDQIKYFLLCSYVYIFGKSLSLIFNTHSIVHSLAIIFLKMKPKKSTKKKKKRALEYERG